MQLVLDTIEKAPQLAGLKQPTKNQNPPPNSTGGKHPSIGGKYPPGHKPLTAAGDS